MKRRLKSADAVRPHFYEMLFLEKIFEQKMHIFKFIMVRLSIVSYDHIRIKFIK